MRFDDFLNMLQVQSWTPDAKGNYLCKCPAHDDSTASLHVKLGRNRKGQEIILIKCFAGCDKEQILAAMGLKLSDLTCKDRPPWEGPEECGTPQGMRTRSEPLVGSGRAGGQEAWSQGACASAAQGMRRHTQAIAESKQKAAAAPKEKTADHGPKRIECIYPYRDEEGRLLYEAVRYRYQDGKKTFRQRRPDPERPGNYLFNMEGVRLVLYRLPEVRAAIEQKQPIFIAEGEKDADNLAALSLCGTSSPMGAGKWGKGDYAYSLQGAECYILPDNDAPGLAHARDIARSLQGKAAHVRILDLRRIWKDMPEKGDVSDLIASLGAEAAKEKILQLMTMQFAERSDMPELYNSIPGYGLIDGCICKHTDNGPRQLCNFCAVPVKVLTQDDGAKTESLMEIRGWAADGKRLPNVRVAAGEFGSLSWIGKYWDVAAAILPGNQVKDQLRYALSEAGRMVATRETEYSHTGWRKLDGKWIYLHGGGAIGGKGVRSALQGGLTRYGLTKAGAFSPAAGFSVGLQFADLIRDAIAIPLLALSYLAPLASMLAGKNIAPSFALFLYGVSGSLKSTVTAMTLSHYGAFDEKTPVASFRDTGNSAREKAFYLKDSILWVDDYHPTMGQQEKRRMDAMAQDLARAFGDHAERGRLNADRTLQLSRPPRALCIMTGEDLPNIGASGLSRFYIIDVKKGDVPVGEELTALQAAIRKGTLQSAMAGYLESLAPNMDKLPDMLQAEFLALRKEAGKRLTQGAHGRSVEAVAHLMLGWKMMLAYGASLSLIGEESMEGLMDRAWAALTEESLRHQREAVEDAPERRYLSAITEMLMSKQAWVIDQTGPPSAGPDKPGLIGWVDDKHYMLLPDMTYQAVQILFQRQGQVFPLSMRATHRMLMEKGLLLPGSDGPTRSKWINNRTLRLIFIPRYLIDGEEKAPEQQEFTIVDEKTPFD